MVRAEKIMRTPVAQWIERWSPEPEVGRSNRPRRATTHLLPPEGSIGQLALPKNRPGIKLANEKKLRS